MRKRIGIVGGGQLGRMLTTPAKELGFDVVVLDPTPHCPASLVGAVQLKGSFTDPKAIHTLAKSVDYLTFEIEHIDAQTLTAISKEGNSIHPSPQTLKTIKDKLTQKEFLSKNKIPTTPFREVKTKNDLLNIAVDFGFPLVIKSRFGGYDGRGNSIVSNEKEIDKAIEKLGNQHLYVEKYIPFKKELAVMIARNTEGDVKSYPVVETIHKNNILHYTLIPAPIDKTLRKKAERFALSIMKHLGGAGVFGIEMFLTKNGEILVNEIAPRVHNSGHYTIEAATASQFEQHIRAVTGLPLGDAALKTPASVMVNILGQREGLSNIKGLKKTLAIPGVSIHLYGKKETRVERKMGHITVVGKTLTECLRKAKKARALIDV